MGYYLNLVNHEEKIICKACRNGGEGFGAYFYGKDEARKVPWFIEYCYKKRLKIEVVHDLDINKLSEWDQEDWEKTEHYYSKNIDNVIASSAEYLKNIEKERLQIFFKILIHLGINIHSYVSNMKKKTAPDTLICDKNLKDLDQLIKTNLFRKIHYSKELEGTGKIFFAYQEDLRISLINS